MNNINGIPIVKTEDIIKPVFDFFNIKLGDDSIITKATEYLKELSIVPDFNIKRNYLWMDKIVNVGSVNFAVISGHTNEDLFILTGKVENGIVYDDKSKYSIWLSAQGNYILSILKESKEEDAAIQHWLNYEDFIVELTRTANGCKIVCDIYDLKGLDFFLFHYMGGKTNANDDNAMFENANYLVKALALIRRNEESIFIKDEIEKRKSKIIEITTLFHNKVNYEPTVQFALDNLRVKAEKFWYEYLTKEVWMGLNHNSRENLIDAFVTETLIENKILTVWSNVVLAFAKVIERELSESLFNQFLDLINDAEFKTPIDLSKNKFERINKRKLTFDMLKKCSRNKHPPTLGQLVFVGKYWNDEIMHTCTNLFLKCRELISNKHPNGNDEISSIVSLIEQNESENNLTANIIDLRNASAHPGNEDEYDWKEYINWLKKSIGQPPKLILMKIILSTRL